MEPELTKLCRETFGGNETISDLKRLTGGASAATWSFNYGNRALILRQRAKDPTDKPKDLPDLEAVSLRTEATLITLAAKHGVKVPQIHADTAPESLLGEAVLMDAVAGEALPQKLFKDPKHETSLEGLMEECAVSLAKIHGIPYHTLKVDLKTRTPAQALEELKDQSKLYGQSSAVLASALNWMETNCPAPQSPVLLHGDFRMGNLLIDENGLSAVLDWELSYIGDPEADVSYFCAPPWRFGRYKQPAGGLGEMADLIAAYEKSAGRKLDPNRFLWWRMHASVNWCLICMFMAGVWRTGAERELERIVIGTRVSESEVDILLFFDEIFGFEDRFNLTYLKTESASGKAETKPEELTQALSEWLTNDIIPNATGREGFKARVARNAIGMLQRQAISGPLFSKAKEQRLSILGMGSAELCQKLIKGDATIQSDELRHHLKLSTLEQISIDQPKYAGFHVALENWSQS